MNQQRYEFHQKMRDEMEKERQNKARHMKKVLDQIHESHEQAELERLTHKYNMKKANSKIMSSRQHDYSSTKQQEKQIEQNLQLFKQAEN